VELVCDEALDAAVRGVWRRLEAAGLPSLATHPHPTNRPHVTLATADDLTPGMLADLRAALAALPVPVRLDGLIFFDGRMGMAVWRIAADDPLLRLQAEVWRALDGAQRNPQHEPQAWVPHISLARRVRPEQRAAVQAVAGAAAAGGTLVAARSYDSGTRTVSELPA
jgi:2'-5' RNA ligase